MRIYLSGGMTGWENNNADAFDEAEAVLTALGHEVTSPVELDRQDGVPLEGDGFDASDEEYEEFLARDLAMLSKDNFDAIVFVRGWEESGGAGREGRKGIDEGLKLFVFEPQVRTHHGKQRDPLSWLNPHEFLRLSHTKRRTKAA